MVTLRLNGLLAGDKPNTYQVSIAGKRARLKTVLSKIPVNIPEKAVAFYAVNGKKVMMDSWVTDGDIIDVFPAVAGG
jgi:molybdopterin converting factor small subunit